jgi:large subunit ribosomal protein L34
LTGSSQVSTLEQSPERRRYGSEPGMYPGSAPVNERDERLTNGDHVGFNTLSGVRVDGCQTHEEITAVAKGKRTFQPNNRRRARVHGFRLRMRTRAGRAIVSNRRRKGRRSLTA